MKRIVTVLCVLCGLMAAEGVEAQTAYAPTVFVTIDAVRRSWEAELILTGVVEGASAPSEAILQGQYSSSSAGGYLEAINSCERYAMVMMSKPGQYKLEVWRRGTANTVTAVCRLTKVNP